MKCRGEVFCGGGLNGAGVCVGEKAVDRREEFLSSRGFDIVGEGTVELDIVEEETVEHVVLWGLRAMILCKISKNG